MRFSNKNENWSPFLEEYQVIYAKYIFKDFILLWVNTYLLQIHSHFYHILFVATSGYMQLVFWAVDAKLFWEK